MTRELTTRETRSVITLLANGRSAELAAKALSVPVDTVRHIHLQYGPDVASLRRSAAQLLRQLDDSAGHDIPSALPDPQPAPAHADKPAAPRPGGTPRPPAPAPTPSPSKRPDFQAGMVPIKDIAYHPSNLGRELGDLRDLTRSIREAGVRVPVVLEQHHGRYRLRDGHRRVVAAQQAGLARIPAIVHAAALDDRAWILEAIDYNLRRQGYTDDDKRRVAQQLIDLGVTRAGIAQAFGITTSALAVLISSSAKTATEPTEPKPKRIHPLVSRRIVLTAVEDWRTRDADATTILAELEQLLVPAAPPP